MFKDLIMIVLRPPNVRLNLRKLPRAIHLMILRSTFAVRMSLDRDFLYFGIRVLLVRYGHLMVAGDLGFAGLFLFCCADKMLCLE